MKSSLPFALVAALIVALSSTSRAEDDFAIPPPVPESAPSPGESSPAKSSTTEASPQPTGEAAQLSVGDWRSKHPQRQAMALDAQRNRLYFDDNGQVVGRYNRATGKFEPGNFEPAQWFDPVAGSRSPTVESPAPRSSRGTPRSSPSRRPAWEEGFGDNHPPKTAAADAGAEDPESPEAESPEESNEAASSETESPKTKTPEAESPATDTPVDPPVPPEPELAEVYRGGAVSRSNRRTRIRIYEPLEQQNRQARPPRARDDAGLAEIIIRGRPTRARRTRVRVYDNTLP